MSLTPTQQIAFDALHAAMRPGTLVYLTGEPGSGKSTLFRALHARTGGALLGAESLQVAASRQHPLALENAFHALVSQAFDEHDVVYLDDAHWLFVVTAGGCHGYPRTGFVGAALTALVERAQAQGKTLALGRSFDMGLPIPVTAGVRIAIGDPAVEDYRVLLATFLGADAAARIDTAKVHRYAPKLTAAQLRRACDALEGRDPLDTDAVIDHLRASQLVSNVDLGEVQAVRLEDLKGVDDVVEALEANVILPLEHTELADELALKPKRGVLLAGPPGTGKTTIGRALAHRLRGKFFLVDGTMIAGTPQFYGRVHEVFEAAMRNAPAVVFIDDSDVIFESDDVGLYRYLLTMLDGLESRSAGRVCLIMTAMDVGSLPPALVRSGRVELWLDTRLPDVQARAAILVDRCAELPPALRDPSTGSGQAVDVARVAAETEGMSGADLGRLVDDGKLLYAHDRARGLATRPATEYFLAAAATVRGNKERYAEAEMQARARRPARPPYFGGAALMGMIPVPGTIGDQAPGAGGAELVEEHVVFVRGAPDVPSPVTTFYAAGPGGGSGG